MANQTARTLAFYFLNEQQKWCSVSNSSVLSRKKYIILAPLKRNLLELDGPITILPMENYVEGPWLYKRNGQYYNVYASMGQTLETISYAVAPTVQGPWTFAGELMPEEADSFTIHPGIIDYKGKSYLFYHNTSLSLDGYGPATGRRSICFTEISYDENGRIVR